MANEPSTNSLEGSPPLENAAPFVSVIIPHYNDLANLERCMRLLAAQSLPHSKFEIVVADNNSRCGLEEVERVCGGLARVVPAPVQGAGAARNAAVEASRGGVLAFIDSDCRPTPTWLEHGLAALSSDQIIGGRVDVDIEDPSHPTAVEAFEKVFAFNFKRYIQELGFSGSGNMFVSREIFDRVGGFRGQVAEDADWGRRALAANYRFRYAPEVVVSHPARRTWPELTQKWRKASREAYAAALERRNGRAAWFLRSFAILASPFVHWVAVARSNKLQNVEQRLKAIGVLFGIRFWRFIECNRLLLQR
jgi:cellulose synthase/poly-beta-1,6-N-acetylglucosamine synthase-like glycosyltransferase